MSTLPYTRLAGFYFFYFAYIGAFGPFFSLYLLAAGRSSFEIGVLMALPAVARIAAPHLWGWLADAGGSHSPLLRATTAAGLACFLGVFAGSGFYWLFAVVLLASFFLSAALPLIEATTLAHLGEDTGRYGPVRVWGSLGYIVAVVAIGYALDLIPVDNLPWMIAFTLAGMLAYCWRIPEAQLSAHASDAVPIWDIIKRPQVVALIAACALMAVAHGPYYTFYSIHVVEHGYTKALTGWLWALGVVCEIVIFLYLPRLYSAFTLRAILIGSFVLGVARFLLIGWGAQHLVLLLLAQALHAATFGSFHAAAIGLVHRLFRGRHQARGQAIYGSLTYGVGGTIGALASGYAWDHFGAGLTFTLSAAAALAGMLLAAWKLPREDDMP
ncbi:MAG TPA: MFS transporter [Burkholderiales bacterium]|nr:MFS transporter [Burkholderiales bacterium]